MPRQVDRTRATAARLEGARRLLVDVESRLLERDIAEVRATVAELEAELRGRENQKPRSSQGKPGPVRTEIIIQMITPVQSAWSNGSLGSCDSIGVTTAVCTRSLDSLPWMP